MLSLYLKVFNEIVRLCMRDLLPCLLRILDLSAVNKKGKKVVESNGGGGGVSAAKFQLASSGSNWKKLKVPVKSYLDDMLLVGHKYHLIF